MHRLVFSTLMLLVLLTEATSGGQERVKNESSVPFRGDRAVYLSLVCPSIDKLHIMKNESRSVEIKACRRKVPRLPHFWSRRTPRHCCRPPCVPVMDLWGARDASVSSLPPCIFITANTSYWMARAERSRMLCRVVAENIWRDDVHLVPGQMGCFCFCGPFDQNVVSNERRQRDESSKDGQCPAGASGQEAGTHTDSQDAQEKTIPSSCVLTSAVMCLVPMVSPVQMVVLLLISIGLFTVLNRRVHRKGSQYGGATLIMPVSSEQRTGREVSERQDTGGQGEAPASTTPAQPEVRRQLPISLVLSDVIDDDPGAYMRSLHCDEIARIFRQSMTPILQSHVTSGHMSEEASAELLERHVRETRDLADDWMGRWQRGVSETLSLSDVWITLLRMRKAALLQEVQGLAGNANRGA